MHMKRVFGNVGHRLHARADPFAILESTDAVTETKPATTTKLAATTSNVLTSNKLTSTSLASPAITSNTTLKTSISTSASTSTTSKTTSTSTSSSKSSTSSSSSTIHTTSTSSHLSTSSTSTSAALTHTLTSSQAATTTALDSAASASATSTSSTSGISTVGKVGIVGAAIVGAALLIGAIMFVVRRVNRRHDDFDADEFKDQSAVLNDDAYTVPAYGGSSRSGPRPPSMFERHNQTLVAFPPADLTHQHYPGQSQSQNYSYPYQNQNPFSDYNAPPQQAYSPGMYVSPSFSPAPTTAAPFLFNAAHSPAYADNSQLARSPSQGTMLTRGKSTSLAPENDYADLNRSSVTPYQAEQYEAISKQLNIPVPKSLPHVPENEPAANLSVPSADNALNDDTPTPNPFDDDETKPARPSSEFHPVAPDFSAIPDSLKPRVVSKPPSLPEIQPSVHVFTPLQDSFPENVQSMPFVDVQLDTQRPASPKDMPQLSPVSSSPQLVQVQAVEREHEGRETPVQVEYFPSAPNEASTQPEVAAPATKKKSETPVRPATVYDDEDAYGGI